MSVRLDRSANVPTCNKCMESLIGRQYLVKDSGKFCVGCYESLFCNSCSTCGQIISTDSRDVSYKDFHFHESCFVCNGCDRCLADQKFIFKDNKFICEKCYEDKFTPKCATCRKSFKAGTKRMEYEGKSYHEKCFCCDTCGNAIGKKSFVKRSDGIFCQDCFESRLASKCKRCKKIIKTKGVAHKGDTYHGDCFQCEGCEKNLASEQFVTHDEHPYCLRCHENHFSKKCHKCGKAISGFGETKMIAFEDLNWHLDCFFCVECQQPLEGEGFVMHKEDTYCAECAEALP